MTCVVHAFIGRDTYSDVMNEPRNGSVFLQHATTLGPSQRSNLTVALSEHVGSDATWRRERRKWWLAQASERPAEEPMAWAEEQVVHGERDGEM